MPKGVGIAPAANRPEPEPFVFRKRHPQESEAEYRDMERRSRERFNKLTGPKGRAKAVKGMLNDKRKEVTVEAM